MTIRERALRTLSIEKQAAARIRAVILKAAKRALRSGVFPIHELEAALEKIIRDYSERPARELYEDSFKRKNAADPDIDESEFAAMGRQLAKNVRGGSVQKRDVRFLFKGSDWLADQYCEWAKGLSQEAFEALPPTMSSIGWTAGGRSISYQAGFPHRFELSERVWKAARESQDKIMTVIDGGRALGRDGVETARDLEELCKFKDGGRRVKGRWGRLAPDKKLEERTNLIAEERGLPTREARKEAIKQLHREGWALSQNPNAEAYYKRLGAAGADYRAIRVERTETRFMLRDEAASRASKYGMAVKWRLTDSHDSGCSCAGNPDGTLFKGNNYSKGVVNGRQVGTPDGVFRPQDLPDIPHPNCMCLMQPVETPKALSFPS